MSTLCLLPDDSLAAYAPGRVLAPQELEALLGARSLLDDAKARAQAFVDEGEALRDEALRHGHEEGLRRGAEDCARRLLDYERSHAQAWPERRRELIELVMLVLARIAPSLDVGVLVSALAQQAVLEARQSRRVLARVHPQALAQVQQDLDALRAHCHWLDSLQVNADDTLGPGDCVLESPHGFVNASWATQLAAVRSMLESQPLPEALT
jgi:flagellar assembly protein FliH